MQLAAELLRVAPFRAIPDQEQLGREMLVHAVKNL